MTVLGYDRLRARMSAILLVAASLAAACAPAAPSATSDSSSGPVRTGETATASSTLFDNSVVHDVALSFDQAAYESMVATYVSSGDKEWIEATVTIDGDVYQRAGIRLKGNSSLRSLGSRRGGSSSSGLSSEEPQSLPWLITLDKFVEGQSHGGVVEFVIRSNTSATALNEAVALELLELAGLASQDAVHARFTANDGEAVLRLVIENPDEIWMLDAFDSSGALYKAESGGDYSYRGEEPEAYDEVFDQEAGEENADLTPLIEFLDFINNTDDATFAAEIESRLDVDAFVTYLAMQELLDNFDDIDGPGNNSYLYYDTSTGEFTVVPWDYNLAFGARLGGTGGPGGNRGNGGEMPPGGGIGRGPAEGGGPGGRSNVLSQRFQAIAEYQGLIDERTAELADELFDSGTASEILSGRVTVLEAGSADLIGATTLATEAQRLADSF